MWGVSHKDIIKINILASFSICVLTYLTFAGKDILDEMPCKPSKMFPQQRPAKMFPGQNFQKQDLIIEDFCESSWFYILYSGL